MDGEQDSTLDDEVRGVGKRTRRGLKWTLLGTAGTNLLRLVTIPILGRLLSPDEFGAVAAALTVILFGQMLRDVGVGAALVQKKTLTQEQIRSAGGFTLVLSTALSLVVYAIAPYAATFYKEPALTEMIRVLAAMFVFRAVGSVSRAMTQRKMRFGVIAAVDFTSYFIGSVASVILAWRGYGVWSLIVGYLLETGLATLAFVIIEPTRFRFTLAPIRELLHFGAGSTLADVSVYFANNGDYLVVGRVLGKAPLGLYTRAYELMRFPATVFTNVAGQVLFSAFARIQDDRERLGRAFRRGIFVTAAILLPTSAGLIVAAPEMIHVLLGDQWGSTVLPFQILALSMMARTSWKIGGTLARAAGDVYAVAIANVAYGALIVVGAVIGAQWGIAGVAVAVAIECNVHYLVYTYLGLRRTNLTWRDILVVHVEAIVAALVALAACYVVADALRRVGALDIIVLGGAALAGLVALIVVAVIRARAGQPDWAWMWSGVRDRFAKRSGSQRRGPS